MAAAALPVALGAMALGAGVNAIGAIQKGNQQQTAYNYNAAIERQNAGIATQEGQSQGLIDRQTAERQEGAITAAYGAGGVDPNRGTPLDVLFDQAATAKLNQQLDIYKANVAATSDINQAGLDIYQGNVAQRAGVTGAVGGLLSSAGQAAMLSRLPWGTSGTPNTPGIRF